MWPYYNVPFRIRNHFPCDLEVGVPFYVGTDFGVPGVFPGAGLYSEISALATLGLSPAVMLER